MIKQFKQLLAAALTIALFVFGGILIFTDIPFLRIAIGVIFVIAAIPSGIWFYNKYEGKKVIDEFRNQ